MSHVRNPVTSLVLHIDGMSCGHCLNAVTSALSRLTGVASKGKALFEASVKGDMQCMKCHKVNGQGGEIGPDLDEVVPKLSPEELDTSIVDPGAEVAPGFPAGTMPTNFGDALSEEQLKALEEYLTTEAKASQ